MSNKLNQISKTFIAENITECIGYRQDLMHWNTLKYNNPLIRSELGHISYSKTNKENAWINLNHSNKQVLRFHTLGILIVR